MKTTGDQILKELNGHLNTELANVEVEENSVLVQFVTTESHDDMVERCNSIKEKVDSTFHERLFYKITVMSL